ncbi:hypothetical protein [Puniceibacterium confluentis]|uniref:hypothetical protein n=1 Tax=Puniceibacterium confluentis TaxID=1958944 RepID=UPI0011B4A2FC|nr:hypothetical protein [Puniceibacterium confluentis]
MSVAQSVRTGLPLAGLREDGRTRKDGQVSGMFDISADFARAERILSDLGRRQLPFAMALAINDTAVDVKDAEERGIRETFDRPTPFTQRGLYVRRASKSRLSAEVGMKPVQAGYLELQAKGGARKPKGRALVVPVSARLNKYGNLPKAAVARAKARSDVFVASQKGGSRGLKGGVYQRGKSRRGKPGRLKMLVAFEPHANYEARWDFQKTAMGRARREFEPHLIRRLKAAIASAK